MQTIRLTVVAAAERDIAAAGFIFIHQSLLLQVRIHESATVLIHAMMAVQQICHVQLICQRIRTHHELVLLLLLLVLVEIKELRHARMNVTHVSVIVIHSLLLLLLLRILIEHVDAINFVLGEHVVNIIII